MTHPTYTHPGANAALLNISRAMRRRVLCTRTRRKYENTPLYMMAADAERREIANVRGNHLMLQARNAEWERLQRAKLDGMLTPAGVRYMREIQEGKS